MCKFSPIVALLISVFFGCTTDTQPIIDIVEESSKKTAAAQQNTSAELCIDMGPQTPRDITDTAGLNKIKFPMAPDYSAMNLCNIHTHTNAEHKGPGFSVFVNSSDYGGYACNESDSLSVAELAPSLGAFGHIKAGDTIEVHWVHTNCEASPGEGLGACIPAGCESPLLRVEAQVFLLVNDSSALDFMDMVYESAPSSGHHQAKMIPDKTGTPIVFRGSTTGPKYNQNTCSPAHVTWSVRPQCVKLDINSLHTWAESKNIFNETKSHGVRQLITAPELLSEIE